MNEILKICLSLSLSGSLLILILLLCRPLYKDRISKRWQYYIWLVVIARLLLPFTPKTSPVGTLFQWAEHTFVQVDSASTTDPNAASAGDPYAAPDAVPSTAPSAGPGSTPDAGTSSAPDAGPSPTPDAGPSSAPDAGPNASPTLRPEGGTSWPSEASATYKTPLTQRLPAALIQNLWLVWLVAALVLFIRKVTIYQSFAKYIRAGRSEVSDPARLDRLALIGEQAGVKRPVELYTNSLISSPLLLGFFKPCIVLPTVDLPDEDFQYTTLHELTHCRRGDMFYKWLVQAAVCLHWFNPLVHVMSREISRACELSCDETVIRTLDPQGRRAYGNTLLNAVGMGGSYRDSLASVTLSEGKELLKERLDAIMKYKNVSKRRVAVTFLITLLVIAGAGATGAYAKAQTPSATDISIAEETPVPSMSSSSIAEAQTPLDPGNSAAEKAPAPSEPGSFVAGKAPIPPESGSFAAVAPAFEDLEADTVRSIALTANSCGIELISSDNGKFTFDYLGVADTTGFELSCTNTVDGILRINVDGTMARDGAGHYYIENGPNYANTLRIGIPDKAYEAITLALDGAPVTLTDLNAAVTIEAEDSSISLSAAEISKGTYHISSRSGSVSIETIALSRDITVSSEGECVLLLARMPQDLSLDMSECSGQVLLPAGWSKTHRLGDGLPTVKIANHGYTGIVVMDQFPKN